MLILSYTKDTMKVCNCSGQIYEYSELNPYQIKRVLWFQQRNIGRAWAILRKYPVERN